jgi:hypothetical protein
MRKHQTPLSEIARLHGFDVPEVKRVLATAGLAAGDWRVYRLLHGTAKLKPVERTVLAAAFDCLPTDFDKPQTRII